MTTSAPPTLRVQVLLFGSYADCLGRNAAELTVSAPATVVDVLHRIRSLPGGERIPARPLCAVNLSHVSLETSVKDGDELAILPPLAGG